MGDEQTLIQTTYSIVLCIVLWYILANKHVKSTEALPFTTLALQIEFIFWTIVISSVNVNLRYLFSILFCIGTHEDIHKLKLHDEWANGFSKNIFT